MKKIFKRYYIYLIILLFIVSLFIIIKSVDINKPTIIKENGEINYKVKLEKNDYYDKDYLKEDMSYVASLINKIETELNYTLESNEEITGDITYSLIAKLQIQDIETEKSLYTKEYVLIDNNKAKQKNNKYIIKSNYNINYNNYNNIAERFKNNFDVDTRDELRLYLKINKNINGTNDKVNTPRELIMTVPLSKNAVSIVLDTEKIDENTVIVKDVKIKITNKKQLIIGLILLVFSLIVITIRTINKNKKITNHDKQLKQIIKIYERMIARSTLLPDFKKYNTKELNDFKELIDVHYNTNEKIKYLIVKEHQKTYFYIISEKELYLYTLRNNEKR